MTRSAFLLFAALALLIGALALKGRPVDPPPLAAPAPGAFDANRAIARLARILGDERPHPVDTAAGDAVRERLIAELRAIGLQPRVTDDWACGGGKAGRYAGCARVRNVVATIGPAEGRHVLLASHYDSTAAGPGASDDGIGVASMLEIAAILKDRKLARPVTFLFDEGEEAGLLGARAFVDHDPLAARVESLINFDSRGVSGPATMFETSRPNGAAIAAFAASSARPVANSMSADVYRLIPNSTDVTVFAERPWTILNFAILGNETRYHSPGDTVAALDRRSLAHMGSQGLAAAIRLADKGPGGRGGERLYTDIAGRMLLVVPKTFGLAFLVVLFAGAAVLAWTRRNGLGRGAGAVVLALAWSAALVFVAQWAIGLARAGAFWKAHPELIALAVDLSALAAAAGALAWLGRSLPRETLRAAYWLLFAALSLGLAWIVPGAAILSLVPPLLFLVGTVAHRRSPTAETVAAMLACLFLFVTWAPVIHLAEVTLDFAAAWIFGPLVALILLPVLIELLGPAEAPVRPWAVGALTAAALAGWAAVAAAPAWSTDRKQGFRIEYAWDSEAGRGRWLIGNGGAPLPRSFPSREAFRAGAKVPWSASTRWGAPAPALAVPVPTATKLSETAQGADRRIVLRLATNGADDVQLRFGGGAGVKAVGVAGSTVRFGGSGTEDPYYLRCYGRSCDGATIALIAPRRPLEGATVGWRNGALPPAAAPLVAARPATAQAQYNPDATVSFGPLRL